ncbi:hypothetical protein RR48_13460 [Papilio machaon]|uniref:Uncharacterized protein n=1 Tax=Papilio machaon TaxID=76193 RepID=A0A194RA58_PAPMA|nr:hypothetical protein RR48_13460 [Papilio machaon]
MSSRPRSGDTFIIPVSRCRVPECDGTNASAEIPPWWPKNVDSKCFRPVVDVSSFGTLNNTCSNATFEETLEECHEWIYENHNSIVAALNLGCQSWKSTLVGSVHNAGMIASVMISGWIADK